MFGTCFNSACGLTAPDTLRFDCPEAGSDDAFPREPDEALFFSSDFPIFGACDSRHRIDGKRAGLPIDRDPARLPAQSGKGRGAQTPCSYLNGPVAKLANAAVSKTAARYALPGSIPGWPIHSRPHSSMDRAAVLRTATSGFESRWGLL